MIIFFWCLSEKFLILLIILFINYISIVFTELNILFFENYSIKKKPLKIQNTKKEFEFSLIHKEK